MKKILLSLTSAAVMLSLSACSNPKVDNSTQKVTPDTASVSAQQYENVLLGEYSGPYDGVPAFDKMDLALLKPALKKGMALKLAEIAAIANDPEPANFANTIVPLEKSGKALGRVFTYWGIWSANNNSPEFREVQAEMVPLISIFNSKITQNDRLFARVKAVYASEALKSLTPEEQRVTWLTYNGFARN
ncbi:MAG: peptidyl-dipeptidase Dcp, partial [Paraglaciecola sp.]